MVIANRIFMVILLLADCAKHQEYAGILNFRRQNVLASPE
jgi:hypothetical protein